MVRRNIALNVLGLFGLMMIALPVRAQVPMSDFKLTANVSGGAVALAWNQPAGFSASYYLVFRADIITARPPVTPYRVIDSTAATNYREPLPAAEPILLLGYQYVVRAFDSAGDSISSNVAVVRLDQLPPRGKDRVSIMSTPPLYGTVDSLYTYRVEAVSDSPSAVLHYSLDEHPQSMTIDSTGMIRWTPKTYWYGPVEVIVTSSLGGAARQEFSLRIGMLDATIAGVVKDTLGNPIPDVMIRIFGFTMRPVPVGIPIQPAPDFFASSYKAETDSTGHFSIGHIDYGHYYVRAIPLNPAYMPEWYNGAVSLKDASMTNVTKDTTFTLNFILHNDTNYTPKFTVAGKVTDSLGHAIKTSVVAFARAGFALNESTENQQSWSAGADFRGFFDAAAQARDIDHHFGLGDGRAPFVFRTRVDSTGAYSISLPEGNYIAFARANGYYKIFYDGKSDILSADVIHLTSDTSNIDFKLTPVPPLALGQISGSVIDSTTLGGIAARVIAFRDVWHFRDTLKMHVERTYSADADTTGAYTIANLPPGNYKVLAVPLGSFVPSFYSTSGPTVKWKNASTVQVNGNPVSDINIYVMPLADTAAGYTSISGRVTSTSNSYGVAGALVYSADAGGAIDGYGITDGTGNYTIAGIAPGTYDVFTDVVGFTSGGSASANPGYGTNGSAAPSTADLTVTPDKVLAIDGPVLHPENYTLEQNYPNPFNPTTEIAYSVPQAMHVTLTVFNVLGEKVATLVDGTVAQGAHFVTWNARNSSGVALPSGVYFYRLSTQDFTAVKKMLLLK